MTLLHLPTDTRTVLTFVTKAKMSPLFTFFWMPKLAGSPHYNGNATCVSIIIFANAAYWPLSYDSHRYTTGYKFREASKRKIGLTGNVSIFRSMI